MEIRGKTAKNVRQLTPLINEEDTCLYKIIFENGDWYLVSADEGATPIVAYGDNDSIFDDPPDALDYLVSLYKDQIFDMKHERNGTQQNTINPSWNIMLDSTRAIPTEYHPTEILLDKTNRGKIKWGQYGNNDYSCTPSYNDACEIDDDCDCSHKPVGCGAVAMGMVMWYWQWPRKSSDIHCKWELIPPELHWNTPSCEVDELTRFLRDCGEMVDMTYWCVGAWCQMPDINSALHALGYNSSVMHRKSDWDRTHGSWNNLIASEIKNNRPVIYYGHHGVEIWHGHYFVVDGNDGWGLFHVNFGHKGAGGWFYLDNIFEGNTDYSDCQYAIVGISPTYNDVNITQLPYQNIPNHQWRTEYAFDSISIPALGETIIVQNGSEVLLEAGKEIELKPGFEACTGSSFEARINPVLQSRMDISISYLPHEVIWGGNGYDIDVRNADSWEFVIKNIYGEPVFFSAGSIANGTSPINLWDGSGLYEFVYYANIRFKNSFGRELFINDFPLYLVTRSDSSNQEDAENEPQDYLSAPLNFEEEISVSPNPSKDFFSIATCNELIKSIEVYTNNGILVFSDNNLETRDYNLDLSKVKSGNYLLVINGTETKKIIKL